MKFSEAALFLNERDKYYVNRHDFSVLHFFAMKLENTFSGVNFRGKNFSLEKSQKLEPAKISCHTVDKKRVLMLFTSSPLLPYLSIPIILPVSLKTLSIYLNQRGGRSCFPGVVG